MPFLPHVPTRPPALDALAAVMAGPLAPASDDGQGHPWVPPELHVFGRERGGRRVVGVVVPAPEVPSPTWYVAWYDRIEGASDGVFPSIRAGAIHVAQHWAPQLLTGPEGEAVMRGLWSIPEHRVAIPPDHVELDGSDGLPLWVPSWSWRASDVGALVHPEAAPDRIERLVDDGRPGSALHLGRYMTHALARYPDQSELLAAVWRGLAGAYAALGRAHYARIAAARGALGSGGVPTARVDGDVPLDGFADLARLLSRDVPAFAGIRAARVRVEPATRTRGRSELVIRAEVGLDPTRSPEGADMARVILAQAYDDAATHGPVVREIVVVGRRVPADSPPPDPNDPEAVRIHAQGYRELGGPIPLPERAGDLHRFARWI